MLARSILVTLTLATALGATAARAYAPAGHNAENQTGSVYQTLAKNGADNAGGDRGSRGGRGEGKGHAERATGPSVLLARHGADDGPNHEAGEHAGGHAADNHGAGHDAGDDHGGNRGPTSGGAGSNGTGSNSGSSGSGSNGNGGHSGSGGHSGRG